MGAQQECFTERDAIIARELEVAAQCQVCEITLIFLLDDAGLQRYCGNFMAMNFVCRDTAKLLEMSAEAEWGQSTSWSNLSLAHRVLGGRVGSHREGRKNV